MKLNPIVMSVMLAKSPHTSEKVNLDVLKDRSPLGQPCALGAALASPVVEGLNRELTMLLANQQADVLDWRTPPSTPLPAPTPPTPKPCASGSTSSARCWSS